MVEMGLVESAIAHRVPHFQGLPFFLDLIERRVHREDVNVVMGVRDPIDRPALAVNKLCIDHVWANAIVVLIPLVNLGFHPGLVRRQNRMRDRSKIDGSDVSSL